ncbi:MAG: DUF1207 domain-containing protein [Planctomyces sp.]|nr:DUF1207 domain-containing protein [Planctomyces sp.]
MLTPTPALTSTDLLSPSLTTPAPDARSFPDRSATPDSGGVQLSQYQHSLQCDDDFTLQFAPTGLLYKSYLAGEKEPRFQSVWLVEKDRGMVWETALGGRVGIIRYGSSDPVFPEGWQLDMEGAALARVDLEEESDLEAADFRFGILSTWRMGPTAVKAGYYHLSSHIGDEYLIKNPGFQRLNYVRDSAIIGISHDLTDAVTVYGEFGYAFNGEDGAKPIELQYGIQYNPPDFGWPGGPFAGINGHTREDFGWITSVNVVGGWQWRSRKSNRSLRLGMQYYDGPAMQWEFAGQHESLLGGGIWFDY